jgi:uncharacterized protein
MSMRQRIDRAVDERVWAVVGASNDTSKFGNRIYRDLRKAGYTVYAVNPNETSVEGDPAYASLGDLPEVPAVVDVVVPSWIGKRIAKEAADTGIPYFWLQPGAESDELIAHAESFGLEVIHNACAMVEKKVWEDS